MNMDKKKELLLITVLAALFVLSGCQARRTSSKGSATGGAREESLQKPVLATFEVEGMSCGGCAVALESLLSSSEGVANAKVDYSAGKAWVLYDSAITNPERIASYSTVYPLSLSSEEPATKENCEIVNEEAGKILC